LKASWFGQSCFLCEGQGIRLVTDPPAAEVGYQLPQMAIDVATVSHGHFDHNNVKALRGAPAVINTPGVHEVKGLRVEGLSTFHDNVSGAQRGPNVVFVWEMDGVRVCHLGDLGHLLDGETLQDLGRIDLLLIPVGGIYTVDAVTARQVVDQIQPRVVVPMHYQTPALSIKLGGVDDFVRLFPLAQVRRDHELQVEQPGMPGLPEVVVLDCTHH
jgi:L-ascorbate metabolism protein UlaG (beta-lactamase superfamily)